MSRAIARRRTVLLVVIAAAIVPVPAHAAPTATADPNLSGSVSFSGSGTTVTLVRTPDLKAAVPAAPSAPRILVVGTGIQRALFPGDLQTLISGGAADLLDTHGYGTIAASTLLQLLPDARITSVKVPSFDSTWHLLDLTKLAAALEGARAAASSYDIVMLAYPPQAALDPVAHLIGHGEYGKFGKGMNMVVEALLNTRGATEGTVAGIPTERALRDKIFAKANLRQRDAVERFANQAVAWRRVVAALDGLGSVGLPVVAPAGDFTRAGGPGGTLQALYPQTVFGLSAMPQVITVGAAYQDGLIQRVSPISGRGPTLALRAKPDLVAPSDIVTLLPAASALPWPDDSARIGAPLLRWARTGSQPSTCPSLQNLYRCSLQGSSMVAASVVAANLSAAIAGGLPNTAAARTSNDDEIIRGIAIAGAASGASAQEFGTTRGATTFEAGAGVFEGLRGFNAAATPVPLGRLEIGEVAPGGTASLTVPLWKPAAVSGARTVHVLSPDASGASILSGAPDQARVTAAAASGAVRLVVAPANAAPGGIHAGTVQLGGADFPFTFVQDVPVDFHVDYGSNEYTGGEGERVERASFVLFAGLPTNVGLIGGAFKNFSGSAFRHTGGDPSHSVIVRTAVTRDTFTESVPISEHGRGRVNAVPPGFYRFHILSDHAVESVQARGRTESLGIQLGSFGPDAVNVPGANLLIPGTPVERAALQTDASTGLCTARNGSSTVAFNVYCGEIAYAVPSAVVSRAVHIVEHDADPARSEWSVCNVNVPLDGKALDFAAIANQASSCPTQVGPTSWQIAPRAPECLPTSERAAFPSGHPNDVKLTYTGAPASIPGRNLPVAVLTYEFKLPYLNTYTNAGLALQYHVDDALVGVRFRTGTTATDDASNGLLVADQPGVNIVPALPEASTKGTAFQEWAVMSSNAAVGQVSIIVIPTSWTGLPGAPASTVSLCDVALRVATFAKQPWSAATLGTQYFPTLDRGLTAQIDPTHKRTRARYAGGFTDAFVEGESLDIAVQVPKNSTRASSAPHRVRSPIGSPASLADVKRWGTDAKRHESVLPAGAVAFDPQYGVTSLACTTGGSGIVSPERTAQWETCKAWNAARASGEILAELTPDLSVNGRFAGTLPVRYAQLAAAAGNIAPEARLGDDGGASESRWVRSNGQYTKRFPVTDFADDASPLTLSMLDGLLRVVGDGAGGYLLNLAAGAHTVTASLK